MLLRAYRNWRTRRRLQRFLSRRAEFHRVAHDMPVDELLAAMQIHLNIRTGLPSYRLRDFGHWVCRHADEIERIQMEQRGRLTERFK